LQAQYKPIGEKDVQGETGLKVSATWGLAEALAASTPPARQISRRQGDVHIWRVRAFSVWLQTERRLLGVGRRLIDAFPTMSQMDKASARRERAMEFQRHVCNQMGKALLCRWETANKRRPICNAGRRKSGGAKRLAAMQLRLDKR